MFSRMGAKHPHFVAVVLVTFAAFFCDASNESGASMKDTSLVVKTQITPLGQWKKTDKASWCVSEGERREATPAGLLYVKVEKTASSTTAGVALRIATKVGSRVLSKSETPVVLTNQGYSRAFKNFFAPNVCSVRYLHGTAKYMGYGERKLDGTSFLFSMIRKPSSQTLSHYFFSEVSKRGLKMNSEAAIDFFKTHYPVGVGGYQLNYLATTKYSNDHFLSKKNMTEVYNVIQTKVLDQYDFIGLVERYDESLVALQLLLGLPAGDMIHFNSKISSTEHHTSVAEEIIGWNKCFKLVKPFMPHTVTSFFSSEDWEERTVGDMALYDAVNRSLDHLIDNKIGRTVFEKALREHRMLMQDASESCKDQIFYPCGSLDTSKEERVNRSLEHCYDRDFGCGYKCIDEMLSSRSTRDS